MAFRPPEFSIFKNTGWITYRNIGAPPIMERGEEKLFRIVRILEETRDPVICYTLQTTKMDEIADLAIQNMVIFYTLVYQRLMKIEYSMRTITNKIRSSPITSIISRHLFGWNWSRFTSKTKRGTG